MSGNEHAESTQGIVFDIQRFCIEDGPGIRTSVFLKGCQLRCPWCSNPESFSAKPQLAYFRSQCKLCGACERACEARAVTLGTQQVNIDRAKCSACGRCVVECPNGAMKIIGKIVNCEDVMEEALRDRLFYEESGGGITLTGGEPTLQAAFSEAILMAAHRQGLHTAVETNGSSVTTSIERLARHTDLFLFDLKIIDKAKSRAYNCADSALVLQNLECIKSFGCRIVIRFPFVPGYTNDSDNIARILEISAKLGPGTQVQVLPFHQYGKHKYDAMGYDYALSSRLPISKEQVENVMSQYSYSGTVKVLG